MRWLHSRLRAGWARHRRWLRWWLRRRLRAGLPRHLRLPVRLTLRWLPVRRLDRRLRARLPGPLRPLNLLRRLGLRRTGRIARRLALTWRLARPALGPARSLAGRAGRARARL